jgi:hypothetical protein
MKSVTEFANFQLNQGIKAKAGLAAEGKTPEEIQTSLGTTFKLEGDKLKYFVNALEVAGQNLDGLKRVRVVSLAEGENAPGKNQKIEEMTYLIEFHVVARPPQPEADKDGKGRGRGGKGGRGGPGRGGPGGPRGPGGPGGDRGPKGPKTDKPS